MTINNTNLPDIDQLTRWANEFFTAIPCDGSLANAALNQGLSAQSLPNTASIADASQFAELARQYTAPSLDDSLAKLAKLAVSPPSPSSFASSHHEATQLADLVKQSLEPSVQTVELHKLLASYNAPNSVITQSNGLIDSASHTAPSFYFLEAQKPPRDLETLGLTTSHATFDVHAVRRDFPILRERVNGQQLVWLDNAATTQKPQVVIDRLSEFYSHENSNIHRAAHELAARATDAYEKARKTVADFLHASSPEEIVFVRGATEAINLVAKSWGLQNIGKDDEIVITWLEHHANIVPWQQLCEVTGAVLRVAPVDDSGQVLLSEYSKLLNSRTKLVSFTHVSNALGTITPAQEMIALAHRAGAKVLLDAAQSVSHLSVDVQTLDCDWLVFSGHKIFGPTGIGALYGKAELLDATQPWQGGGNMIEDVTFEKTVYQPAPARFEAGTGNIADAVGLGSALEYLQRIGVPNVARYEHELLAYAINALQRINGLRLIGTAVEKTSVLSFVLKGHSTQDIGTALNKAGIAVRSGHHCAQPILRRFGVESTVRPSLAFYNTHEEIDRLVSVVRQIQAGQTGFY
jgi:cysteine desulfurase/selenocysteine lyase